MHDERLDDARHLALLVTDRRRLVRAATRLLGPAEAEDVVQDAYLRALEAEGLQLNAAQAWLLSVLRNLAIDRLRRRGWMQHWLAQAEAGNPMSQAPSAETDAALAEEAAFALRLLATHLAPTDGAALLLHEVFELSHADIARASGRSVENCRQLLRRSLLRLRRARDDQPIDPRPALETHEDTLFRCYVHALQQRDPQALLAMLGQTPKLALPAHAAATLAPAAATGTEPQPPTPRSSVTQVGGQLGLVLTLDGVTLCVLPLGLRPACEPALALN